MCYTGYIGSTEKGRIQVDSGSTLSIMSRRFMQFLRIPPHGLTPTNTIIFNFGFNANGSHSLGNIRLRCQIGDLESEVT